MIEIELVRLGLTWADLRSMSDAFVAAIHTLNAELLESL